MIETDRQMGRQTNRPNVTYKRAVTDIEIYRVIRLIFLSVFDLGFWVEAPVFWDLYIVRNLECLWHWLPVVVVISGQ